MKILRTLKAKDIFKSKAQQGFLFARKPELAKEFASKTPETVYKKLPEHVEKKDQETYFGQTVVPSKPMTEKAKERLAQLTPKRKFKCLNEQ
jgi:hypothetical protein